MSFCCKALVWVPHAHSRVGQARSFDTIVLLVASRANPNLPPVHSHTHARRSTSCRTDGRLELGGDGVGNRITRVASVRRRGRRGRSEARGSDWQGCKHSPANSEARHCRGKGGSFPEGLRSALRLHGLLALMQLVHTLEHSHRVRPRTSLTETSRPPPPASSSSPRPPPPPPPPARTRTYARTHTHTHTLTHTHTHTHHTHALRPSARPSHSRLSLFQSSDQRSTSSRASLRWPSANSLVAVLVTAPVSLLYRTPRPAGIDLRTKLLHPQQLVAIPTTK